MSLQDIPLPSPPPDPTLREHMSGLFSRALADKIASNVFSDPPDSEGDAAGRKRVGFHPWTTNILEPQLSTPDSEIPPSLKSLPPSRDCQLTVRPILKPSLSAQSLTGLDGQHEKVSSLDNMDSLLRNLAVNERSSSVDAYQTITSLIKTYDEAPEQGVLQKKMVQLQKYIKRDLSALDIPTVNLPSEERLGMNNLVLSALKVLVIVVWSPVYSPFLSDEFRAWSVDRAIRVLKEHQATKPILIHYMHLIGTQNFRPTIVTPTRVQRILEAIQDLTEHIPGKAVVAERLLVYQKLIQQSKHVMKTRTDAWVKNVFSAMGHSFKEVRSNAVSAGTEACTAYAGAGSVAAAARIALADVTGDRTLSVSITNRLERVLAAKDEANQIPQIWTLVLLLCNSGQQKVDSWQQLPDWLKLIQRCFNSSDVTVRVQAFLAWNRFYYIARPHEASDKVVSMLAKPAMIQLDKTGHNQPSKGTRQAVASSYCMLLYYAFRPSASPGQYTRMWNEFVVKSMTRSFLSNSASNCDLSCRILAALFHSSMSKTRVWNENRAHENAALDPLELPAIDCKWVRSKTPSILSIFQLVVEYSSFGPSGSFSEQAYAAQAWRNLMQAIKESTSKEIKPSSDTKVAFNSIIGFLRPASIDGELTSTPTAESCDRLSLLAKIAIDELGLLAMLQAVDDCADRFNTVMLKSLIQQSLQFNDDYFGQQLSRDQTIERCLRSLDKDLKLVGQAGTTVNRTTRCLVLEDAVHMINLIETYRPSYALLTLQPSIGTIIQDASGEFLQAGDVEAYTTTHQGFCNSVLRLFEILEPAKQESLGELMLAAAASAHPWLNERSSALQHRPSPIRGHRIEHEVAQSASHSSPKLVATPNLENTGSVQNVNSRSSRKSILGGSASATSRSRKSKSKPRHDDSQIQFVSVESSPPDYTFESQLLTTRQKEVRARQHAEPAVTFANIRSSPSTSTKKTPIPEKQLEEMEIDLPGTPTLPLPNAIEDEEQPPTPTPKARKSRRLNLEPVITSSPPSVSGDDRDVASMNITSSPVKDVTEADDAISFEDFSRDAAMNGHDDDDDFDDENYDLDEARQQTGCLEYESPSKRAPRASMAGKQSPPKGSTIEEYETAEADKASPIVYSDEYDALAASQLSQSLEETSFLTAIPDNEDTPEPRRTTRKRKGEQRDGSSSKKRRRSGVQDHNIPGPDAQRDTESSTIEDTIYVSVEKATPSSARVTRARAAQEASDLSQMSQGSPANNTPKTRKAKGSRRPGRPRKRPRSQSSRNTSPASQVPVPDTALAETDVKTEKDDVEMIEVEGITASPSLRSEVAETIESKSSDDVLRGLAVNTVNTDTDAELNDQPATPRMDADTDQRLLETTDPSTGHVTIDVVSYLSFILDSLNDNGARVESLRNNLPKIHSLCFKIGLKAQELVNDG